MRRLDLRKKFETRGWQKNELFSEYCHHKLILGNRVPIAKEEMIDYIIDGIPSKTLRNPDAFVFISARNNAGI